ncbi:MAG: hypothetical protein ABL949_01635 [Fimbriimonadaceae bacterium]
MKRVGSRKISIICFFLVVLVGVGIYVQRTAERQYAFLQGQEPTLRFATKDWTWKVVGKNYNWRATSTQTEKQIDQELSALQGSVVKSRKGFGGTSGPSRSLEIEWQLPGDHYVKLIPAQEIGRDSIIEDPKWSRVSVYRIVKPSPVDLLIRWVTGH